MNLVNAFLGVVAIIGIIIVGGFIIFFLGDLVLSVLDPNYVRFGRKKAKKDVKKENQLSIDKEETKKIEYKPVEVQREEIKEKKENNKVAKLPVEIEQGIGDDFFDDINNAKKEENLEEMKSSSIDDLRAEEELFRANMLKAIEERRLRKDKNQPQKDIDFEKFFFDDDDIDVFENEQENSVSDETDNEEIDGQQNIENLISQKEDEVKEIENSEEEKEIEVADANIITEEDVEVIRDQYETEIVKLENEKLAIKQEKERLEREKLEAKEEIAKLVEEKLNLSKNLETISAEKKSPKANLSLEEYEARLQKLQERLAENDKDLRRVKKDFMPLKKVNNTLESDEKKLRRREAIVAKQKVILYGVNNIVDIDQEKAKKLTEDLDLLEGLKLSVKHCQEVMATNKDRYPILEKTYNILLKDNEILKSDIEELEKTIAKLKEEQE